MLLQSKRVIKSRKPSKRSRKSRKPSKRSRKSPKSSKRSRKSRKPSKRSRKSRKSSKKTLCKKRLSQKIAINMDEYKTGRYKSRGQAIAVSYAQVKKMFPRCKKELSRRV